MIEIRDFRKQFGRLTAVEGVSLEIRDGETFALLGPNGSGKTTTLKALAGLARPTSGRILVDGVDLWGGDQAVRRKIGYLPQRSSFPDQVTAAEILEFYCRLRRLPLARSGEMLRLAGLESSAGRRIGEFSGGMAQRLGIAVACLPDADVLVLDEPTASLDPEGTAGLRRLLAGLKERGRTIVFSSHVLADADLLAERVAMLVEGRLVAVESVEALRARVSENTRLRIRIGNPSPRWEAVAESAGAAVPQSGQEDLVVLCGSERRLGVLQALEAAGAEIASFRTEEPLLEDFYLKYVPNTHGAAGGPVSGRLPDPAAAAS